MTNNSPKYVEDTVTQEVALPGQEKWKSDVKRESKTGGEALAQQIDIASLKPVNNNVIIKCKKQKKTKGGLYLTEKSQELTTKQIVAVSHKVSETNPDIKPGLFCHVMFSTIRNLPDRKPCATVEDNEGVEYEYWKVAAEEIEYLYEFKS